ncbi:MAG: VCBS repeat-containing protein [Altererythrobacter sp.]
MTGWEACRWNRVFRRRDADLDRGSADFDGDGMADLAIAHHEQSTFTIAYGKGDGSVGNIERHSLPDRISPHVHMIRAADIGGDGRVDLLVDSRDSFGIFTLRNVAGSPGVFEGAPVETGGAPYLGFALGDIDGDGLVDIVTPNQRDTSVLLQNSSGGTFRIGQRLAVQSPFAVALADIDGDGATDLIVASDETRSGLFVFAGAAAGCSKLRPVWSSIWCPEPRISRPAISTAMGARILSLPPGRAR